MRKEIRVLKLALVLPVILFSCEKKADSDDVSNVSNVTNVSGINSTVNLVTPVNPVRASEPPESIGADLTVATTDDAGNPKIFTVATQSEYNSMDYKNRIFSTGLRNAIQYLIQTPTNQATSLQFDADNTYSIVLNPSAPSGVAQTTCNLCGPGSMGRCIRDLLKYLKDNGYSSVKGTISVETGAFGLCLVIVYGFSNISIPSTPITNPTNGGIPVEVFTPTITYPNLLFDKYIARVQTWVRSHDSTIPLPGTWSKQQLVEYISIYNNDQSHPVFTNQNNDVFQAQLEYFVYDID